MKITFFSFEEVQGQDDHFSSHMRGVTLTRAEIGREYHQGSWNDPLRRVTATKGVTHLSHPSRSQGPPSWHLTRRVRLQTESS